MDFHDQLAECEALRRQFTEKMELKKSKQQQIDDLHLRSKSIQEEYPRGSQILLSKTKEIVGEMEHLTLEVRELEVEVKALLAKYEEAAGGTANDIQDRNAGVRRHNQLLLQQQSSRSCWVAVVAVLVVALVLWLLLGRKDESKKQHLEEEEGLEKHRVRLKNRRLQQQRRNLFYRPEWQTV